MSKDLANRIESFLSEQSIANVATDGGDRPHVAALEYVSRGLELYFASLPHTQKVANLAGNPALALTVNGPGRSREDITGVQYFGIARRVGDPEEQESIQRWFMDKFLLEPAAHWFKSKLVYYAVTPERIDLIDYAKGFGHKETWTP